MVGITDQKNFRPKVFLQGVLGFDCCQIVASRDDTTVEDEEIVLTRIKRHILATSTNAIAAEGDKKINCHMAGDARFHGSGTTLLPLRGQLVLTYRNYSKAASTGKENLQWPSQLCKPLIPKLKWCRSHSRIYLQILATDWQRVPQIITAHFSPIEQVATGSSKAALGEPVRKISWRGSYTPTIA